MKFTISVLAFCLPTIEALHFKTELASRPWAPIKGEKYVGCFKDEGAAWGSTGERDLPARAWVGQDAEPCIDWAIRLGLSYVGLQYGG